MGLRTVDNQPDPLADCGRNAVGGDAQIRPHAEASCPFYDQLGSVQVAHWIQEEGMKRENGVRREGGTPSVAAGGAGELIRFIRTPLPSPPAGRVRGSLPSRRHVITGVGEPRAAHLRVTLLPSRTTMSVLEESRMSGGTAGEANQWPLV